MKNHKFVKGLALFGLALTMLISLIGCPTTVGRKADITISFDSSKIDCKVYNTSSKKWIPISSGTKVSEGDQLFANAKTIPTGHIVSYWKINEKQIQGDFWNINKTKTFIVKKTDTVNNQIAIDYFTKIPETAKIEFNDTKVKCSKLNQQTNDWDTLANDAEIKEADILNFVAIGLTKGKTVKKWTLGSTIKEEAIAIGYTVKEKDITANKLTVSYTERDAEKFTLEFDESKMYARKFDTTSTEYSIQLNNGAEIYENEVLKFYAINLALGKGVEYWTINGNKKNIGKAWLKNIQAQYSVKKSDSSSSKIVIDYKTKSAPTYKIIFDSTITCQNQSNGYSNVTSGTAVNEGARLHFTATPPAGKAIDKWMFGSQVIEASSNDLWWQEVSSKVANSKNEIHVSYTTKSAEEITINFDENMINCEYYDHDQKRWVSTDSDNKFLEGTELRFIADLPTGKKLATWSVGSISSYEKKQLDIGYTVSKSQANSSNEITVSYTTEEAKKITINFDSSIRCSYAHNQSNEITTGTEIYEDVVLCFVAKPPTGTAVNTWIVGSNNSYAQNKDAIWYTVSKDDANTSDEITVSYTTKTPEKITINFTESKMVCQDDEGNKVNSGDKVDEGTHLIFDAKNIPTDRIIDTWTAGNHEYQIGGNRSWYTVSKGDATASEITVSYTTRPAEKITINFTDSEMECSYQNNPSQKLSSGDQVNEGTKLVFDAKGIKAGEAINDWTAGTHRYQIGGNRSWYTVSKDDANASNEITVSYTIKNLTQMKIFFDSTRLTCEKNNTEIESDTVVYENDQLFFVVKNIPDDKLANWTLNNNEFHPKNENINMIEFSVETSHANGDNEIHIAYTERDLKEVKIVFDPTLIKCVKATDNSPVNDGDKVLEKTELEFSTVSKYAVKWIISGIGSARAEEKRNLDVFSGGYYIAPNGDINVSYSTEGILKPIDAKYVGNYNGAFTGAFKGTWNGRIDEFGRFDGEFVDDGASNSMYAEAILDEDGNLNGTASNPYVEINFTATIAYDESVSGTWENSTLNVNGTLTGSKQP